jgi:hypothetical protein
MKEWEDVCADKNLCMVTEAEKFFLSIFHVLLSLKPFLSMQKNDDVSSFQQSRVSS